MTRVRLHLASPSALMAIGLLTGLFMCWHHWGAQSNPSGMSTRFRNDGHSDLEVFWIGSHPDGSENRVAMFIIPAGQAQALNTFSGHVFAVVAAGSYVDCSQVTMAQSQPEYAFDCGGVEGGVDPSKRERTQNTALLHQFKTSIAVKFRNLSNKIVLLWYDDGGNGVNQAKMEPGGDATTNSYPGHKFCFTREFAARGCRDALHSVTMHPDTYTYVFDDGSASAEHKRLWAEEVAFSESYRNSTGRHWTAFYPRPPPKLYMWPADHYGQVHKVKSQHTHYHCVPRRGREAAIGGGVDTEAGGEEEAECRAKGELEMTLKVLSAVPGPRIFQIENLLSEVEANHIIDLGRSKVKRSKTGQADSAYESDTRTSKTGWINRRQSPVVDSVFRRTAELLRIDQALLDSEHNAELLQVVHYDPGQKYDAHHDWGVDNGGPTRFVTLLLYLNQPESGGQTAFPLAKDNVTGDPITTHPGLGSAVLFYNLLEDGNTDDTTLHAALPVIEGEKWLANFWIWDPFLAI